MAGALYRFNPVASIGWKGMIAFVNYASGDTDDRGENARPDQEELDFTIDFKPTEGILRGSGFALAPPKSTKRVRTPRT